MNNVGSNLRKRLTSNQCSSKFNSVTKIGSGQYGDVFKACLNEKCQKKFAYKVSNSNLKAEHNLTKKFLRGVGKKHGANVYAYEKCGTQFRMYSEFLDGQPLKTLLPSLRKDPARLRSIVFQVLTILRTLKINMPSFRHNDLHLDNVFVTNAGTKVRIIDFGLSFSKDIKNPEINSTSNKGSFLREYGIYRGNHPMYDVHFFLNSLYVSTYSSEGKGYGDLLNFITSIFPVSSGYLGRESSNIYSYRLRPVQKNTRNTREVTTFDKIFRHSYMNTNKAVSRKSAVKSILKPRTVMQKKILTQTATKTSKAGNVSMSQKLSNAAKILKESKTKPLYKRPAASKMKPPLPPRNIKSKSPKKNTTTSIKDVPSNSSDNNETLQNMQTRLLQNSETSSGRKISKTPKKRLSRGRVSSAYVRNFMKSMTTK
tara:strand:+ start:10210 stop:11487 length:1278 start_codon:yes stop_codon:yes gene_type:complete